MPTKTNQFYSVQYVILSSKLWVGETRVLLLLYVIVVPESKLKELLSICKTVYQKES